MPMTEKMSKALRDAKNGDEEAAEWLVIENTGLIWSVARRFFGRGIDADDLFQLGCVGFMKAIMGFDEQFGTQFSTYAVPKISGEIRRFIRDDGTVKVSRGIKEKAVIIKSARSSLEQKLGREPFISEVSEVTGLDVEDIAAAEAAIFPAESLQQEKGSDGFTLEQVLGDFNQEEKLVEVVSLRESVSKLPEKERNVIALRYFRGLTQDKTAKILGVSQVQVSRLEKRAIEMLRESML